MISATIEVKVNLEEDASDPTGYRFVNLSINDEPTIPVSRDIPISRRFVQQMIEAAKRKLSIKDKVAQPVAGSAAPTQAAQVSMENGPPNPMPNAPALHEPPAGTLMTPGSKRQT